MPTATLSPRVAAAARRLKSKPTPKPTTVVSSGIPDTFPDPEQRQELRRAAERGEIPHFVFWAALEDHSALSIAEFEALTPEQQEFVRASLASRGLMFYRCGDRKLSVMRTEDDGTRVSLFSFRPDQMFAVEDPRVRHWDQIDIVVHNGTSAAQSRKYLREFLADLAKLGVE